MAHETPHGEQMTADTATLPSPEDTQAAPANPHPTPEPTKRWWSRRRYVLVGFLILILAAASPYGWDLWQYYHTHESTDNAYVVGDIVPISPRVSGTVLTVLMENHQQVEAGQILARLDPRDSEMRVRQAEAAVAVAAARLHRLEIEAGREQDSTRSDTDRTRAALRAAQSAFQEAQHGVEEAQARLRTLEAGVDVAQAEVDSHQARLDMARTAFTRTQQLLADGVVAQQQFDAADSARRAAEAERRAAEQTLLLAKREVEQAQADLQTQRQAIERARAHVAEAQAIVAGSQANRQNVAIKQAEAEVARGFVQQKRADLAYAQLQLGYTTLRAPVAGVIAQNHAEVGQVVQAGRPVLAIVPLHNVWVEANFKETQLRRMRAGQPATLKVDAYSGQVFTGTVASISPGTGSIFSLLPPENATGNFVKVVQRVPVKIILDAASPDGLALRPGLSVIATIATD
ncbi:MAG: HlyD family secretion protein [Candidatus Tectomicrobia bacterium]|nr:HlyD family secretion protein [Candidatus Tectomicrobia bacterium]